MVAIVKRETPQADTDKMLYASNRERLLNFISEAMKSACTTSPTKKSETARLPKKTVDGERSEGVLNMAPNTKEFPMMAVSISGALRAQLMMAMVSG